MDGDRTLATSLTVLHNGQQIEDTDIHTVAVDQDLQQADMCSVTVNSASSGTTAASENDYSHTVSIGDSIEVKFGEGETAFEGEVVGIEPTYKTGGETRCTIRAFNRLHRLLRGRVSRTYADVTDSDVAALIAKENGLSAECDPTEVVYPHLYQHNQTELEFLLHRADINGFEVKVVGDKLLFREPKSEVRSDIVLELNNDSAPYKLKSFSPRLSTAGIFSAVEVRGWDPEKKEPIIARQAPLKSRMGKTTGPEVAEKAFGSVVTFDVDHPSFDHAEAAQKAEALMHESMMNYIVGDGVAFGYPDLHAGMLVSVKISDDGTHRFNGVYRLDGVSHRYSHTKGGGGGGFTTAVRFRRDAEGGLEGGSGNSEGNTNA